MWASARLPGKPFVWGQPPFDSCAPTVSSWQLGKVRDSNWENGWHIQMCLSYGGGVAEQLEEGEPGTWLMPGSGEEGQRPILWAAHAVIPGLAASMAQRVSGTTWHGCVTSKHRPGTGGSGWGEVGVSGSCLGSTIWTSISREATSPTPGALQRFLQVTLPSVAVMSWPEDALRFRGIIPWVTLVSFWIE